MDNLVLVAVVIILLWTAAIIYYIVVSRKQDDVQADIEAVEALLEETDQGEER